MLLVALTMVADILFFRFKVTGPIRAIQNS